jgi:hypothetical protein
MAVSRRNGLLAQTTAYPVSDKALLEAGDKNSAVVRVIAKWLLNSE